MSKWMTSDTGILRKKVVKENHDDLLVFGYACKLFRDDEKAKFIDQGKHLIPWMADDTLRIDRYDGRGALSDLKPYEASREGYDAMRWLGLSDSERKIELLCDEERYYALNTNEEEEEMYKEEEKKRLQQKTNEFAYSYDVPQNPELSQNLNPPVVEEEDKDYVPRPELDVPVDIAIPKKEKENARIEKTALFVSKQGLQLEILIKTKQANNPQFSFLNQDSPLYKYYKHVLEAIKSGRYKVESNNEEEQKRNDHEQESGDEHYLHPSLQQTSVQTAPATTIPTVTYKPDADCAYSQLVNRIQGSQGDGGAAAQTKPPVPPPQAVPQTAQMTYEQQQQYYQYYYSMQYYEYYKQLVQQFHSMGGTDGQTIPPMVQDQINSQAATLAQMAITQYMQQNTSNPYAQIVSNLSHMKDTPNQYPTPANASEPPTTTEHIPPAEPTPSSHQIPPPQPKEITNNATVTTTQEKPPEEKKKISALVHYSSGSDDSEEETEGDRESVEMPPEETKMVIEKMASYVAKNGSNFESIVRSKGDLRFDFLTPGHIFYPFYKRKIEEFSGEKKMAVKSETKSTANGTSSVKTKDKKVIAPVSFSIKKPKEEIPKDIKSALPLEESDEDLEEPNQTAKPSDNPPVSTTPPLPLKDPTTGTTTPTKESPKDSSPSTKDQPGDATPPDQRNGQNDQTVDSEDPILEMIDLTEDLEERKDARRAEDKIKDKLAAAAREKLAMVAKDRALQMERRKKAAAFLKLKAVVPERKMDDEDKVLVVSDSEGKAERSVGKARRRSRSRGKEKRGKKEDSESEEGEIKKRKSKKKKSYHHKRKRSRSRHRTSSHHKKSKKKRQRSASRSSCSSQD